MITQRGNILFLILLAVVLFAALSYAVTQGMRGGGKDAGPEKFKTLASQILQNVSLMENTMMRAMTVNGVPGYGFDLSGIASSAAAERSVISSVRMPPATSARARSTAVPGSRTTMTGMTGLSSISSRAFMDVGDRASERGM